jgi:hypothetical protein
LKHRALPPIIRANHHEPTQLDYLSEFFVSLFVLSPVGDSRGVSIVFATFKRSFFAVLMLALLQATATAADVSVHEVYEAAQAGHLREAQAMMQQVLRDHPNSAKAHYIDAEILAKGGQLAAARAELATAERLEPGLPFASASAVQVLRQQLSGSTATTVRQATEPSQFPWGLALLGLALVVAVVMFVRAMRQRSVMQAGAMMPGANYGPQPGYGQPGYGQPGYGPTMGGGGMGGGIMGGLATGAALGAGMVAGEALAHRFMGDQGHSGGIVPDAQADNLVDPNSNLGGADFGVNDSSSWDDNSSSSWDSGGGDFGGDSWS